MLSGTTQQLWKELLATATDRELVWMDGYLSGVLSGRDTLSAAAPVAAVAPVRITIAYGTETGNAKSLATRFTARARERNFQVRLVALEQYKPADLQRESYLLLVVSTQGDGEPPEAARPFYDFLHSGHPKLPELQYAVLGLGDTAYPLFCQAAIAIDQQLQQSGAAAFASLQKCDTDYEPVAMQWLEEALDHLALQRQPSLPAPVQSLPVSAKQHYQGEVTTHINLNDTGSSKETYHIELQTDARYEPGDAIGIMPVNEEGLVQDILALSGMEGATTIHYRETAYSLHQLLKEKLNITYLPGRVIRKCAAILGQDIPVPAISLQDLLKIYGLRSREVFLEIIQALEPNAPRLYSIASSPEAHPGTVHLTVAKDRFLLDDGLHDGLCSGYLSGLAPGAELTFYVHANKQFRLPAPDKDIIMIGPGTGIAPFRAFLSHREATGATGRNWLFFGAQHFVSDFLYQTEIQSWQETGILNEVQVAFSRDQEERIYVQHRMLQQGHKLYSWLEQGASIYICGSKEPMSRDVEAALLQIIAAQGKITSSAAELYLQALKEDGRFHVDVY